MKRKLLFLVFSAAILFSSIITSFAQSVTAPEIAEEGFNFTFILKSFLNSNAAIISAVICAAIILMIIIFSKKIKRKLDNSTASQLTNAFIAFFSISGIACLALAFATEGATWSNLMHINPDAGNFHTQFEDYILNLQSAGSQQFYEIAATNTPFSHLIFFLLAQFVPTNYLFSSSAENYIRILRNQTFMYLYLILVMFCIILIYRMNRSVLRNNNLNMRDEVVSFLFVVSYPTFYCIERGNIAGISIVLVMSFLMFRDAEKTIFKELSYVALAAAAAITPYVLIFSLLLIDKKSKNAVMRFVRTTLYFLILFITPAVFTGFGNLLTYVKSFLSVSAEGFVPGNMSIANLLHFFGINNVVIIYAIIILTDLIAALAMVTLPSVWQKTAAACYIILNIYSVSQPTVLIFVFIPLVFLLAQNEHRAVNWVYMFTFTLLVTPFPEWFMFDADNFTVFLASMGIENIQNANNLISLAATQFILVILFFQMTAIMRARKLRNQTIKSEQLPKSEN